MIDRLFTRIARPVQARDTGRDNVMDDSNNSVTAGARGERALRGAQRPANLTRRPRTESRPARGLASDQRHSEAATLRRPGRGISASRRCRGEPLPGLRGGQRRRSPGRAQRRRSLPAGSGVDLSMSFPLPPPLAHPGQDLRSVRDPGASHSIRDEPLFLEPKVHWRRDRQRDHPLGIACRGCRFKRRGASTFGL